MALYIKEAYLGNLKAGLGRVTSNIVEISHIFGGYLRIIFSVVTTMIKQCMYDLRVFLTFYLILLVFFSSAMNVLSANPSPMHADQVQRG